MVPINNVGSTLAQRDTWKRMIGITFANEGFVGLRALDQPRTNGWQLSWPDEQNDIGLTSFGDVGPTKLPTKYYMLAFDFCVPCLKCIKVCTVTLKNNDVVERHGTQRRLRRVTILYSYVFFLFDDKLINYRRIWFNFLKLINHLAFWNSL